MAQRRDGNAAKRVALADAGPWKSWSRRMSRHGRAIKFIQTYCIPPKGVGHGQPLRLATFQKHFLEEALAEGTDVAIMETPRGNGKSTFGGAIATWAVFDDDETGAPQVPIIATTIGQAIRSCYGVAASMVKRHPDLERRALIYTGVATPRIVVPYHEGELFPISNDPDGLQGLDPSLGLVDEIGFQPVISWDSLRLGAGKRERSLIMGVGTPGVDKDNALWSLRSAARNGAELPGFVFHEYGAPEGCAVDDRKAWRIANPGLRAGFLRVSALEVDLGLTGAGGMPEGHFRIFRLGQWYEGTASWLGPNGAKIWDALEEPYDFEPGAPTWAGVDMSRSRDSSAVVAVQRDAAGKLRALTRVWHPEPDTPVDATDVMQYLRDLHDAYDLRAVSWDPRFFDVPASMLSDEGLEMVEVPQSPERMTPICGSAYELITGGLLRHDGDEVLRTHVLNAVPRFNERGFTLQKSKSKGRIDAAIALALAADRALHDDTGDEVLAAWR